MKPNLMELKRLVGALDPSLMRRKTRDCKLFPSGFPIGGISEIQGIGKLEIVAQFLSEHSDLQIAWIERDIHLNPYALWQRGVNIHNLVMMEAGAEVSWCIQEVLKSQIFQVVVVSDANFEDTMLRKFQILTEKSETNLILLSPSLHQSWVPWLQLEMRPGCTPHILRNRSTG